MFLHFTSSFSLFMLTVFISVMVFSFLFCIKFVSNFRFSIFDWTVEKKLLFKLTSMSVCIPAITYGVLYFPNLVKLVHSLNFIHKRLRLLLDWLENSVGKFYVLRFTLNSFPIYFNYVTRTTLNVRLLGISKTEERKANKMFKQTIHTTEWVMISISSNDCVEWYIIYWVVLVKCYSIQKRFHWHFKLKLKAYTLYGCAKTSGFSEYAIKMTTNYSIFSAITVAKFKLKHCNLCDIWFAIFYLASKNRLNKFFSMFTDSVVRHFTIFR